MSDMLKPPPSLLCKVASITVHADEMLSSDGHDFDRAALAAAIQDPEVRAWIDQMTEAALAPRKRHP
jgi:hypothetical protein